MRRIQGQSLAYVVGGLIFVCVILFGVMFFAGFWKAGESYKVSAYVTNARGIAQNSTVFEAGLPVGLVKSIKRYGPDAILTLRIDEGVTPLPVDSKVQLGLRSLAGETNVQLTPGTSGELVKDGGSLGLSQNEPYTEVDQILTELSGPTEQKARNFFQGLGKGVDGKGQELNDTVGGFSRLVNDSPPLTSTLASQHEQVADVVQNFGTIMDAISQRTDATIQFARGARKTFEVVASRQEALRDTLHELPYIIKTNTDVVAALETAHTTAPVIDHLASTMRKLKPTLDLLGPASVKGLSVLRELGGASPGLTNVLQGLEDLEPSSVKTLPQVHSVLCQANPMARFLEPYDRDLAAFFSNFGATTNAYLPGNRRGHMLFTSAHVDPPHLFRGVTAGAPDQALTALYNFGIFSPVASSKFGYHALPGPGNIGAEDEGVGMVSPIDWGKTHEYPRVLADCKK